MGWLLLIMVLAGVLGGTVGWLLDDAAEKKWAAWFKAVLLGLAASLLVPLFLEGLSSKILTNLLTPSATGRAKDYLLFAGFCLIAAISARRFIATLSDRVIADLQKIKLQQDQIAAKTEETKNNSEAAKVNSEAAVQAATVGVGKSREATASRGTLAPLALSDGGEEQSGKDEKELADPRKGQFGGKPDANGRILEAEIQAMSDQSQLCVVSLRVRSTDPAKPLVGTVQFFLHPTFQNDQPTLPVVDGMAKLSIISWGAFTVGAACDGGATRLELDLAAHPDAKEPWRSR